MGPGNQGNFTLPRSKSDVRVFGISVEKLNLSVNNPTVSHKRIPQNVGGSEQSYDFLLCGTDEVVTVRLGHRQ